MSYSRLYRSITQRVFGGVAGGIGEYFNMDPVIIRVIFVLTAIFGGGSGIIIYIVLWIAVPERPYTSTMFNASGSGGPDSGSDPAGNPSDFSNPETEADITARKYTGSMIGGVILISIGALILATMVIPNVFFSNLWPFILVVAGIILIVTSMNQTIRKEQP